MTFLLKLHEKKQLCNRETRDNDINYGLKFLLQTFSPCLCFNHLGIKNIILGSSLLSLISTQLSPAASEKMKPTHWLKMMFTCLQWRWVKVKRNSSFNDSSNLLRYSAYFFVSFLNLISLLMRIRSFEFPLNKCHIRFLIKNNCCETFFILHKFTI